MEDVVDWMKANKIPSVGDAAANLARVNLVRKMTHHLPPFAIGRQGLKPMDVRMESRAHMTEPRKPFLMMSAEKRTPDVTEHKADATVGVAPLAVGNDQAPPKVVRNIKGLADILFDEIDAVRAGKGDETRIKQICQLSVRIVELMSAEAKFLKMSNKTEARAEDERNRLKQIAG
jgi:hypothetical protein